jgi:hypothetical protein
MSPAQLQPIGRKAFAVGVVLTIVSVASVFVDAPQFFRSYLFAWTFWAGLTLGGFGLLMLHHLVGGRWGFPVRRFFEAAVAVLPLMVVCFLPLLFGLHDLYIWARPAAVRASAILQRKHGYMNAPFFVVRMVIYFTIYLWIMTRLGKWSRAQDATSDPQPTRRLRSFSGPAVVLFFLTATFADVDLILSLEPDWYSTVFSALVIIGNALGMLALAIILLTCFRKMLPYAQILSPEVWHHLGNLLLAFVMLWAYLAFSQLLIVYSGNLPQEIVWYLHRCSGSWKDFALVLGLTHFAIPFAWLLFRDAKRQPLILARIAGLVLAARVLDAYWTVAPAFPPHIVELHWQDVCLFIGLGGIWFGEFLRRLLHEPLVPLNDPRMPLSSPA